MKDGAIAMDDLPEAMKASVPERTASKELRSIAEMEKLHIQHVLEATGNNKTKAAEILGIDRKTLREKLK